MMDAVSATIFDGVRAISKKHENLWIKWIKRLFYRFILNQANTLLPNPFRRGCPHPIERIHSYHVVGGANGTTMVVMFVG